MKTTLLTLALAFGLLTALPAEASDCYGTAPAPAPVVYKKARPQARYPQTYTHGKKTFQHGNKLHQKGKRQSLRAKVKQLDAAGKLSRRERRILEQNLSDLRTLRQNARYDGAITAAEKARLKNARQKIERNLKIAARY